MSVGASEPTLEVEASVPTVAVERLPGARDVVVIDLRSPAEFAQDHIPGAHNVPLFDDVQRALVGTLYKQSSPEEAFGEGRRIVRERIESVVARIAEIAAWEVTDDGLVQRVERMTAPGLERMSAKLMTHELDALPEQPLVLHCWRGGLRSRSVVAFVRALGLERAVGLTGGYKAWRAHVLRSIERWSAPPAFVLRGLTGVGKTLVLRELEALRPRWTVDLEGLARHRSSLLGMVGLEPCSQRLFESRTAERLAQGFPGPVVFEGESRKVGDATIPPAVWEPLHGGVDIELTATVEQRVRVLEADYLVDDTSRDTLRRQLPIVERRMKRRLPHGTLVDLLDRGQTGELVRVLLEHYYDPLYRHGERQGKDGTGRRYAASFEVGDPRVTAQRIAEWIDARRAPVDPPRASS